MSRIAISSLPQKYQDQAERLLHPKPLTMTSSNGVKYCVQPVSESAPKKTLPLNFRMPFPPSANRYWRSITVCGRGRVVVSKEAKDYKNAVASLLFFVKPMSGPLRIVLRFYRPRKRGDLDNMLKVTFDSLKGIAFHDDEQICHIDAARLEDKEDPHIEVWIHPAA